MVKKTYSIEWSNCSEVVIEVDHDVMTDEALHKINDLFLDSEDYLLYTEGKIVDAYCKCLLLFTS